MGSAGTSSDITVGIRQTMRMLERNRLDAVYVAKDADQYVIRPIIEAAGALGVAVEYMDSKRGLGSRFGIEIGAAAAGRIADKAAIYGS